MIIINLITIKIFITDTFDLAKIIDILKGRRIMIGDSFKCELLLNYLKTVDDINNWIISVRQYYQYEIKIVNMKHPKYKQIIKLINLTNEHGILQQKVNRFKYGIKLLSNWLEQLIDSEMANQIKQEFNQKTTGQIKFDELINIFFFKIIEDVAMIMIFLIEFMFFFLNYYFTNH